MWQHLLGSRKGSAHDDDESKLIVYGTSTLLLHQRCALAGLCALMYTARPTPRPKERHPQNHNSASLDVFKNGLGPEGGKASGAPKDE